MTIVTRRTSEAPGSFVRSEAEAERSRRGDCSPIGERILSRAGAPALGLMMVTDYALRVT